MELGLQDAEDKAAKIWRKWVMSYTFRFLTTYIGLALESF